ncbi:hypothetical protein [Pseudoclavibacter caeni]|jgi:hypothetical protein|uniref:Hemagglutinin n=1 Tax=Pseudoclavibacter caeni TaxID=908846 RepID=A0A7C8FVI1_9MICO|nr:hypothetical protein [Pseudoclavibacter caeni]KAB1633638.1 hypothetical protein F8O02_01550 [Pseudoclavibacter caeni]NYJ96346.1 hypothetical protein [Pseudoclavibacter caeni]
MTGSIPRLLAHLTRPLAIVATTLLGAIGLAAIPAGDVSKAEAASGWDFDAGYIISDSNFYDSNSMDANSVQAFLNAHVPTCHPEWDNNPNDITCLKDYWTQTTQKSADAYCRGYNSAWQSAAQIIDGVARSCGISQKVLLVTLQKENALVDHAFPSSWRYTTAMGYGCPDGAACDAQYFGLFNQIYNAARQFRVYAAHPSWYRYRAGQNNYIQWNPDAACGGSTVYIRNQATASLYNYTPYQPNNAAKAAGYGLGDGCSSYGNRNFFLYYSDWFGNPITPPSPLVQESGTNRVFFLSAGTKYYISTMDVLYGYQRFGQLTRVSSEYLTSFVDGTTLQTTLIRNSATGEIAFFSPSGWRHNFTTCTQMADFGLPCQAPNVSEAIFKSFQQGDAVASGLVRTFHNPAVYSIQSKALHHVVSNGAWQRLNPDAAAALMLPTLPDLPLGDPILADGDMVRTSNSRDVYYFANGRLRYLSSLETGVALGASSQTVLTTISFGDLPIDRQPASLAVSCDSTPYLLTGHELHAIDEGQLDATPVTLSTSQCSRLKVGAALGGQSILIGTAGSPDLYLLDADGTAHRILTWDAAISAAGTATPVTAWVDKSTPVTKIFRMGSPIYPAVYLAKNNSAPEVFLVDDQGSAAHIPSFSTTSLLGLDASSILPLENRQPVQDLVGYSPLLKCDTEVYTPTASGLLRLPAAGASRLHAFSLSASACAMFSSKVLPSSTPAILKGSGPEVYLYANGTLTWLKTMAAVNAAAGSTTPQILKTSDEVLTALQS